MESQDQQSSKKLSPHDIRHLVLGTTPDNYENMIQFYVKFLAAKVAHGSEHITFLRYDEEHHRLGIVSIPGTTARSQIAGNVSGLRHIAFGFSNLTDLATFYEQKKAQGIKPQWIVNHGISTSMYFTDPDGNELEALVDNFDTAEEAIEYMSSPEFHENPIGVDYDPEEFLRRVRSGEDEKSIKTRPNIGPRARR
ncbi:hypothetical protein H2203_005233 [Taxawa tesnikishii (nom. ined.)]|nr:hypothetical protein H2203_005233 [Dothideales sp. JES 119]